MKIVIMGYSGAGKSTLCRSLAEKYHIPALHLDTIQFLPDWEIRDACEKQKLVISFLDSNPEGWVIDGNYSKLSCERRVEEADVIVLMLFGRISCLRRCILRYRTYKGRRRPDMAEGCAEKMDREFISWILWQGRTKKIRNRYRKLQKKYSQKVVVLKNQKQLDRYMESAEPMPENSS